MGLDKLMPRDLIAMLTLGCGFVLLALGYDGFIGSMLVSVVMFYFGAETLEKRKRIQD